MASRSAFGAPTFEAAPEIKRGSRNALGEPDSTGMELGRTYAPELDVKASGSGIHLTAIGTGPNAGFSITSAPPPVLGLRAIYSPSLDGQGFWAKDQNGMDNAGNATRPSDSLRYCTLTDITTTLKQRVIAHEIGAAPAMSHFTLLQQQLQYPASKAIFERTVVNARTHTGTIASQWGALFDGFIGSVTNEHAAFDAATSATPVTEQAIGCAFDWELGPEN